MKPKTMILMVVAVGCGLGASYMTSRLLAERGNSTEEQEKVVILVARKNLDTGATIKDPTEMFAEKAIPRGDEPKSAVSRFDEVKGRVLKHTLREGDFVSGNDLLSDKESWIAYSLPKGHMAMGIRVNMEGIAGGFASLPLSRVDVIATIRDKGFSQVLLQNVLVLAADQQTVRDEGKGAMPAAVVTVALTPEQILKASLAKEFGPLSLVLRKFNDNKVIDNEHTKVTLENILNNTRHSDTETQQKSDVPQVAVKQPEAPKVEQPKVEVAAPKTHTHIITILNAERQEQWEFTLDEDDQVVGQRLLPRDGLRGEPVHPAVPPSLANPPPPGTAAPAGNQPNNPPAAEPKRPVG
jgi:Flp pilus assembly protein CpaB